MRRTQLSRRRLIHGLAIAAAVSEMEATELRTATEEVGPGPFYKPGSPERHSLREKRMDGEPLRIEGKVFDIRGRALSDARVEVWHVDSKGEYDNAGFRLRGQVKADKSGTYWVETMKPVAYGSRCAHVHVRVSAPGRKPLATEIQFEGDPAAAKDSIARRSLAMPITKNKGQLTGTFHFVLRDA